MIDLRVSRNIAAVTSAASLQMEGTAHPEWADMLRIAANEMERLIHALSLMEPVAGKFCSRCGEPVA